MNGFENHNQSGHHGSQENRRIDSTPFDEMLSERDRVKNMRAELKEYQKRKRLIITSRILLLIFIVTLIIVSIFAIKRTASAPNTRDSYI